VTKLLHSTYWFLNLSSPMIYLLPLSWPISIVVLGG
jgi:hypothetical protein